MTTSTPDGRLLSGGRGWTTVLVLALALLMLVAGQFAGGQAQATGLAPAPEALPLAVLPPTDPPAPAPAAAAAAAAAAAPAPAPVAAPVVSVPVVAAAPAPAPAPADLCSGEGWQQRRGEAALAAVRGGAGRTGFSVSFAPAREGYLGLTHLHERRIEVFVRGCDTQSDTLLRHVMAHELGHAYDTTHLTPEVRAGWQAARGIPASTDWYGCSGCTDFATPAGDFAEVYAQWARGASDNRSELAGAPGPDDLAALAGQFFGA